ncbi:MAG: glutamate-1-semialdehyde 2,1-aminomutase [Candidatus Eisenbacteria bacterium]|nr:glutamate-1-semialdehyde 2,1-aminomutase [Candidatus Latescibacterota bacterium]MBD3302908.1 glutamate-1-semialdehyde 2,1-aminomutase [Candidatus Eisenbacteria bacterium]
MPGGVNSPVRAFRAVGGNPPFLRRGAGSRVVDEDGNEYIDLVGSWGPLILGHAHPEILEAIERAGRDGTSFGAPTAGEVELAERIVEAVPSIESVRLVNSGTEATMSAIRLARGATGRDRVVKFEGCYHGHGDPFLIQAGSGAATFGHPSSPGVTAGTARDTLAAPYNDLGAVERLFAEDPEGIACVIVEPVAANMGVVLPERGFLEGLRDLCDRHDALLVFDEVITGFRLAYGGAQERFGVRPDLTTLGKVIGGGLPVGAYGGRRDLMRHLAPEGPVYQAGTLSGNPLAVAAGTTMLRLLREGDVYERLERLGRRLRDGIAAMLAASDRPLCYEGIGSLGCLYFRGGPIRSWDDAAGADTERFGRYHREMLRRGVSLAPSQFEAAFLSAVHTEEEVDAVVTACRASVEAAFGDER